MSFGEEESVVSGTNQDYQGDGLYGALQSEQRAEEEAEEERARFDPSQHMIELRGRGGASQYIEVKWRIVWFRDEYEHGGIVTEMIKLTDNEAIFKATVTDGLGGIATGHGSETQGDFGDFLEKAETKAIGRALASLGYGTSAADHEMGHNKRGEFTVVDSGVQRQPQRPRNVDAAPRPAKFDTPRGNDQHTPATPKQLQFLQALRSQTGLAADTDFAAWLDDQGFNLVGGEEYGKLIAGQIINKLSERKGQLAR